MERHTRGFTLIELLVVIAIIAVLASIVLVSLNSARNRGKDTRVIADVQQLRVRAESTHNGVNYNTMLVPNSVPTLNCGSGCLNGNGISPSDSIAQELVTDVGVQGSRVFAVTNVANTAYAIFGQLTATTSTSYFCLDSTGRSNSSTPTTTPTIACQ